MITISTTDKAYSKAEAAAVIRQAVQDGNDHDGATLSAADLKRLYLHFQPRPPAKPKTPWDWVARASNDRDCREWVRYVHVTADGCLVATDGRRAHWIENHTDAPAAGTYETGGLPLASDTVKLPERWRTAVRADIAGSSMEAVTYDPEAAETCEAGEAGLAVRIGVAFYNLRYVREALAVTSVCRGELELYQNPRDAGSEPLRGVVRNSDGTTAHFTVMPIRV